MAKLLMSTSLLIITRESLEDSLMFSSRVFAMPRKPCEICCLSSFMVEN